MFIAGSFSHFEVQGTLKPLLHQGAANTIGLVDSAVKEMGVGMATTAAVKFSPAG